MNERTYSIYDSAIDLIAEHCTLDIALLLLEAIFNKYHNDPRAYIIQPDEPSE